MNIFQLIFHGTLGVFSMGIYWTLQSMKAIERNNIKLLQQREISLNHNIQPSIN